MINEIEQGKEAFIPRELSVTHLPYSFRYYDPIVNIIKDQIDNEFKLTTLTRNEISFKILRTENKKFMINEHLGIGAEKIHAKPESVI